MHSTTYQTASGSSGYEEHYTFDLVTVDDREYSTETTLTTENSGGGTNIDWELWDHEERHTTTDHYDASFEKSKRSGVVDDKGTRPLCFNLQDLNQL